MFSGVTGLIVGREKMMQTKIVHVMQSTLQAKPKIPSPM